VPDVPTDVPIIDMSPAFAGGLEGRRKVAEAIDEACREIGFLIITGHGISDDLCERVLAMSREFFDLPAEEKLRVRQWEDSIPRGFSPIAAEAVSYSRLQLTPGDLKESFTAGPPDVPDDEYYRRGMARTLFAANRWPARPAGFEAIHREYFHTMERLGASLMQLFALSLGLDENFFDDKIDRHTSVLRVINYPAQVTDPIPGQLRAGEHSDYGTFTILRHEREHRPGGLQVRNRAGNWIDVRGVPNSFVVNLGDTMARWTNDRWVSTMHRVVNPPRLSDEDSRRLSLVFFHQTNYDTVVECIPSCVGVGEEAKYPPVTFGDYLNLKFTRQVTFERGAESQT